MAKLTTLKGPDAEFLVFPALAALARRPMTIAELSRTLLISRNTARTRVLQLASEGYVIQRADKRWQLIAKLGLIGVPTPDGAEPVREAADITKLPLPNEPKPKFLVNNKAVPAAKVPPTPTTTVSERAAVIASRFGLPQSIEGVGEVRMGTITPCKGCAKPTPYCFGEFTHLCKDCAAVWKGADNSQWRGLGHY